MIHRIRHGRTGTSPAAADASMLDDDDMLQEILLRLPPQPSSLPRAATVCKRWQGLVGDPRFFRQFHAHHRRPPVLGVFERSHEGIVFTAMLDPPDRIPSQRFSLGRCSGSWEYTVLNCRHGLVLVHDWAREEVLVCDPITSEQHRLTIPPELTSVLGGAVFCAAPDLGHPHGGCHSSHFKVVLVSRGESDIGDLACIYSSENGLWGNLISMAAPCELSDVRATLVGNALYWLSQGDQILEFDLNAQELAMITGPHVTYDVSYGNRQIIRAEDGDLGFGILYFTRFQTWQRKVNFHGVATWVPWKTIETYRILGLPSPTEGVFGQLLGYDEDNGVIFLYLKAGVYMIQLISMQSRKLYETHIMDDYHPFTSFFTPDDVMAAAVLMSLSHYIHMAGIVHMLSGKNLLNLCRSIDCRRMPEMYDVGKILGGAMLGETIMDHYISELLERRDLSSTYSLRSVRSKMNEKVLTR